MGKRKLLSAYCIAVQIKSKGPGSTREPRPETKDLYQPFFDGDYADGKGQLPANVNKPQSRALGFFSYFSKSNYRLRLEFDFSTPRSPPAAPSGGAGFWKSLFLPPVHYHVEIFHAVIFERISLVDFPAAFFVISVYGVVCPGNGANSMIFRFPSQRRPHEIPTD